MLKMAYADFNPSYIRHLSVAFPICHFCKAKVISILGSSNRISSIVDKCDIGYGSHVESSHICAVSAFYSIQKRIWLFTNDERRKLLRKLKGDDYDLRNHKPATK